MSTGGTQALDDLRVVELSVGPSAAYAARMFADLGADVIKMEPPGGDPLRRREPYVEAARGVPTTSGVFAALNAGKRSVTLDHTTDAAAQVEPLLRQADVFITDAAPGELMRLGLSPEQLRDQWPHLVIVRLESVPSSVGITASSLHANAISGYSSAIGAPDREPIPLPYEIAEYVAGANAAAACLAAVFRARRSGDGELVEVATSDVLFSFGATCAKMFEDAGERFFRSGRRSPGSGGAYPLAIFRCSDGYVVAIGRTLADWDALRAMMGWPEWSRQERFSDAREIARTCPDEVDAFVAPWFAERTRQEAFELSVEHGFPLAPVLSVEEVLAHPQFAHRGLFMQLAATGDHRLSWPGLPFDLSAHPISRDARTIPTPAAPGTLSFHRSPSRPPAGARVPVSTRPLDRLLVLDLGWVWSAPMVCATLADLGADVIKVEHSQRLDNSRLRGRPTRDGVPIEGPVTELSSYFHQNNRGKRSITIDIKHPAGRDLLRELALRADVVVENLSPGVYSNKGLGYEHLRPLNPGLIWLSMSSVGQAGPLSGMRSYAPTMTSLAGVESLVGYPDEPVMGLLTAGFGDPNSGSHALVAVMAALVAREIHGVGQFIDFSQVEANVAVTVEALVEWQLTGELPPTLGSRARDIAPHGHYPCRDRQWIALSTPSEETWRRLVVLVGAAELDDSKLEAMSARLVERDLIDAVLWRWTATQCCDELVQLLVANRIDAAPVWTVEETMTSPIFAPHVHLLSHPYTGVEQVVTTPWRFATNPVHIDRPAPQVGEHTADVLSGVLGMSPADVDALARSGALR